MGKRYPNDDAFDLEDSCNVAKKNLTLSDVISKKQKRKQKKHEKLIQSLDECKNDLTTSSISEPNVVRYDSNGAKLTIALPGSILDNAQSPELAAYLAGQVARAASIFNVDEIFIFNDGGSSTMNSVCNKKLARILQYLECPQYLRKRMFPIHEDLKYAGILNPTDMPHHLREDEISVDTSVPYREGIVCDADSNRVSKCSDNNDVYVYGGLKKKFIISDMNADYLQPGLRVTLKLDAVSYKAIKGIDRFVPAKIVSPSEPKTNSKIYWGYDVRLVNSLSDVMNDTYDLTIGTSERGENIDNMKTVGSKSDFNRKKVLIVFGGVKGLEVACDTDSKISTDDPSTLFDIYLNTCISQGSRTIRTEEAILISLTKIVPLLFKR